MQTSHFGGSPADFTSLKVIIDDH